MAGLYWHNDNYVCHEATCPVCGKGGSYGCDDYRAMVRVYYSGGTARSTRRQIQHMRIECGDTCTVGTGDVSGLYVIFEGKAVNWSASQTRNYLSGIGSPFAGSD